MSEKFPLQRYTPDPNGPHPAHVNGAAPSYAELEAEDNAIREYWGLLRRHWLVVLGMVLLTTGLATYKARTDPPQYRSSAVVRLTDVRRMLTGGLSNPALGAPALGDPIMSQIEVLRSRSVTGMVVDQVGLRLIPLTPGFPYSVLDQAEVAPTATADSVHVRFGGDGYTVSSRTESASAAYGFPAEVGGVRLTMASRPELPEAAFSVISREAAAARLQGGLMAVRRDRTDIIDIGFTAGDPILAQRVVNAAVDQFQAFNQGTAQKSARQRRIFIEGQLAQTDSLLRQAQFALASFRSDQRVFSTREGLAAQQMGLASLTTERNQLLADREVYEDRLAALQQSTPEARVQELRSLAADPRLTSSPAVAAYYEQFVRYQTSYDSLMAGGRSPTHPDVQRVAGILEGVAQDLLRSMRDHVAGLETQIQRLNGLIGRGEYTMETLPPTETEEVRLFTEVEHLAGIAGALREEYQQAQIEEAVQAGQIELVDPALPGVSIMSGDVRTILFGLVLGLMLGGGAAILLEKANTSIRRKDEVEKVLRIPELAVVPRFAVSGAVARRTLIPIPFSRNGSNGKGHGRDLIAADDPHSTAAEAYRTLRTNLIFSQSLHALGTIAVTSSAPAEGKSATAANLATTFAQQGRRVLLVDCDLRKARLHKMFGVPREPGFTHLLLGLKQLDEVVRETHVEGLSFLPSGTLPPNPAELVGGEQMQATLELLRREFDLVVLDTPPLLAASDAALLGRLVDGMLLVVRAGQTERDAARQAVRQLVAGRARILGAVLNDPDGKVGRYGGHYQYEYYGHKA